RGIAALSPEGGAQAAPARARPREEPDMLGEKALRNAAARVALPAANAWDGHTPQANRSRFEDEPRLGQVVRQGREDGADVVLNRELDDDGIEGGRTTVAGLAQPPELAAQDEEFLIGS